MHANVTPVTVSRVDVARFYLHRPDDARVGIANDQTGKRSFFSRGSPSLQRRPARRWISGKEIQTV